MSLESYKLTRQYSYSNPRKEMLREKKIQINNLYELAMDREDDTLLNGNVFTKSPRIFNRKLIDKTHHEITVETILEDDWIECGDYLEYDNMVWLCLNSYSFHKLYCRATFMSCDWKLYWINENGKIISQYVIDQNSTQYNSGETSNSTMTLGSAQHMLKMQCNENTILLDSPMRFAIDRNIKKPTCYKVTQNDNSAYNYGKGLCCVTVTETQLNNDADKLITLDNGKEVWICNYNNYHSTPTPPTEDSNETIDLCGTISGNKNLKIDFPRTYTVNFTDKSGNKVDWANVDFNWNIVADFDNELVEQTVNENKISLKIDNDSLIGESFLLQCKLNLNGLVIAEIEIIVADIV